MPTYFISWSATVRGIARVDADNASDAENTFQDAGPILPRDTEIVTVDVVHVEEADPNRTLP